MKIYIAYIQSALVTYWMVMFFFGISAGFANYAPIVAIAGSALLLVIATPLLVYNAKIGLVVGLIACLLMLPQGAMFLYGAIEDKVFNWGVLVAALPFLLTAIATYLSAKKILGKNYLLNGLPANEAVKWVLITAPIILVVIYLISIREYLVNP